VFGVLDAFFFPAVSTLVPRLVEADELEPANALHQGVMSLSGFVGPALAGVLVATAGTGPAFVIDALSFAVAAATLLLVRVRALPEAGAAAASPKAPGGLISTIRAGLACAWADPGIRALLLLSAAFNLAFSGPVQIGLPWLADVRFGDPVALGIMFSGWGAGALIGSIVAGSMPPAGGQGMRVLGLGAVLALGIAAIPFLPNVLVVAALIAAMGVAGGVLNVGLISWIQRRSAPEMLGRVMSLLMLASVGLTPISLAVSGALVDVSVAAMFVGGGVIVLATVAVGLATGAQRHLDSPTPVIAADPAPEPL